MSTRVSPAEGPSDDPLCLLVAGDPATRDRVVDGLESRSPAIECVPVASVEAIGDRLTAGAGIDAVLALAGSGGIDARTALRTVRERMAEIPVFVWLSPSTDPEPVLDAGATDVLRAPLDPPTEADCRVLGRRLRTAVTAAGRTVDDRETVRRIYDVISDPQRDTLGAIDALLELGTELFDVELGMFSRIDDGEYEIRAIQPADLAADLGLAAGDTLPLEATYCERTARTDETVSFRSLAEATPRDAQRAATTELGAACYVGTPIRVDEEVTGTFCFFGQDPRAEPFTDADRTLLEFLGDWIGAELTRERRERELQNTFDRISDGFFAVDDEWRFTYVNDRFEAIMDRTATDLIGENIWETFPEAVNDLFYDEYHRAMREQTAVAFEEYFEPLETWFDVRAYPDENGLSVYFQDITDRKRRETALETLYEDTRELMDATTMAGIARTAVDALSTALDVRLAGVFLFDADTGTLRPAAVSDPVKELYADWPRTYGPESLVWATYEAGEVRRIDDVEAFRDRLAYDETPVRSGLLLPMGEHGIILAADTDPAAFDASEQSLARLLAASTESALDRADREQALRIRTRAMEKASIPLCLADPDRPDMPLVYVNEAFEAITGYEEGEAVGRNCRFLQGEATDPAAVAEISRAIEAEAPVSVELLNYRADGTTFWNQLELTPIHDEDGTLLRYLGSQRDVTDRREREARLRGLLETSRALMDAETNDEIAAITARAVSEILGYDINCVRLYDDVTGELTPVVTSGGDTVDVDDRPVYSTDDRGSGPVRAFESGDPVVVEHLDPRSEYGYGDLRSAMYLPFGTHGTLSVASPRIDAFDETDVRIAELLTTTAEAAFRRADRREELRQYETVLENVQDMVYVADAEGRFQLLTSPLAAYLGYERDALLGEHVSTVLPDGAVEEGRTRIRDLVADADRESTAYETEIITAEGTRRPVEIEIAALPTTAAFGGTVGTVTDITELTETREELRVERDRFRYLFENIPDPVTEVGFEDGSPVVRSVNDAFESVFGHDASAVAGRALNDLVVPEGDRSEATDLDRRVFEEGRVTAEVRRATADGPRDFLFRGIRYDLEGATRAFGIYTDITDQRRRQRHLQVLNRVLRHNLRNDLNVVLGFADHLAGRIEDPDLKRFAVGIAETADHLAGLSDTARSIERVLDTPEAATSVGLASVLEDVAAQVRTAYPAAEIAVEVPASLSVLAGPQFRTAVEHLVENAIEHNPAGDPRVWIDAETTAGDRIAVRIRDNGPGLPPDEHAVVTEDADISQLQHGSGLGLWLAKWAIEGAGGELGFETPAEGGTLVTIELPTG